MIAFIYSRKFFLGVCLLASLSVFAQTPSKPTQMGYVSIDYLLQQQPEYKNIQTTLTTKQEQLATDLKRLNEELRAKAEAYQKENSQLNEITKLDREKELQHLQNRIEDFEQAAQKQLKTQYSQLMDPLIRKIQTTLISFAKENNYRYIFNSDKNSPWPILLYAPEEDALNDSLLKKMGITLQGKETKSELSGSTAVEKGKETGSAKNKP